MSRKHIWYFLRDQDGHKIPNAKLKLYHAGTKDLATIYSIPVSGTGDIIDQSTWTTNTSGFFEFFIGDFSESEPEYITDTLSAVHDGSFDVGSYPSSAWSVSAADDDVVGVIGVSGYYHDSSPAISTQRGASTSGMTYYFQEIDVVPGTEMILSFWSRGGDVPNNGSGRYSIHDLDNDSNIVPITDTVNTSDVYIEVTDSFIVPVGCTRISLRLWVPDLATGIAYYDDVDLTYQSTYADPAVKVGYLATQKFDLQWVADTLTPPVSGILYDRVFFPFLLPVVETDQYGDDYDKMISNQMAYTFENHIPIPYSDNVHGLYPVDVNNSSDATFNKLVSDDLMYRALADLTTLLVCGGEAITISTSGALLDQVATGAWTLSGDGSYYTDVPHTLARNQMYPVIQFYDINTKQQFIPKNIMDINNQQLRIWVVDNTLNLVATIVGQIPPA